MAAPTNVRATAPPYLADPLLSFKFLVSWDGQPIAGITRVSALSSETALLDSSEDGVPQAARTLPGETKFAPITLERGLIADVAFEQWAKKVWEYKNGTQISLADIRKDVTIRLCNQAGQVIRTYVVKNCWPSNYTALPVLDANTSTVALEAMTLQNEGWQRDDDMETPRLPSFSFPG